tara:strand:+ start:10287 stop:10790 length:504 start_codon:yes stop_codon:yes gene_type:complete
MQRQSILVAASGALLLLAASVADAGAGSGGTDDPLAVLKRIYVLPTPYFDAFHDREERPKFYTRRIHEQALRMEACFHERFKMEHLDYDYIVPGQDYNLSNLKITLVSRSGEEAAAKVTFASMGEGHEVTHTLRRVAGHWLIDDSAFASGGSLFESLSRPCTPARPQ